MTSPRRRAQLTALSSTPALQELRRSLVDLLPAASTAHQRLSDQIQPEALSVDLAHALSSRGGGGPSSGAPVSALDPLRSLALTERDFPEHERGIKEQGAGSFVSICRCRLNPRRLFAVKSVTKAIARKAWPPMEPLLERKLLSRATQEEEEEEEGRGSEDAREPLVPRFYGSYQTGGSLNIVMEYFREGDAAMYLDNVEAGIPTLQSVRSQHPGALLKADLVRAWGVDMIAGIAWLHEQGFLHRDIKPSNFLISHTGHLKMCDFGTAAPFGSFTCGASSRYPSGRMRRVLNSHNDEAGTTDYISPEIVDKVVQRARKRNWQRDHMMALGEDETVNDEGDESRALRPSACPASPNPRRRTDPDGPGDYGPEIDWWALGITLFEMAFGRVPFEGTCNANGWGAAAQQDEILKAEECLRIPECQEHDGAFVELLRGLICPAEKRLGRSSSEEVKSHPFFAGADWAKPYSVPAPWLSPLEPERPSSDPSPSLLHSPRPQAPGSPSLSTLRSSFNYSALNGLTSMDVPQFPSLLGGVTMVDEGEQTTAAAATTSDKPVRPTMPTSLSAPELSLLHASTAPPSADEADASKTITASRSSTDVTLHEETAPSHLDTAWVGFTHLPTAHAFDDVAVVKPARRATATATSRRPFKTPKQPVRFVPVLTPADGETSSPEQSPEGAPQPVASTPYGSAAALVGRRLPTVMPTPLPPALMTPAVNSSAVRSLHRRAIESCARAASNSPLDSRQPSTPPPQRKTSMPNLGSHFRADAQAQHSAALLAQTPASAAVQPLAAGFGTVSRRNARLLARAVSQTPSSHNSSALRHMAEKEAWDKMMEAVQRSVRKPSEPLSGVAAVVAKKPLVIVTTKRSSAPSTLPTITAEQVEPRSMPRSPSLGSDASSNGASGGSSPLSARLGFGTITSEGHLAVHTKQVTRKRSARQLLLRAQERTTPTKPNRATSPLLTTTFDDLSIASRVAVGSCSDAAASSSSSAAAASNSGTWPATTTSSRHTTAAEAEVKAPSPLLAMFAAENRARSSSLGRLSRPSAALDSQHPALGGESGHRMKRRESREMLSQFRKGIAPVESSSDDSSSLTTSLAPTTRRTMGPVASPSLPSLPDAFGSTDVLTAPLPTERTHSIPTRRASMMPLRTAKSFANLQRDGEAGASSLGRASKARGLVVPAGGTVDENVRASNYSGLGKPIKRRGTLQHLSNLFESHHESSGGAAGLTSLSLSSKAQAGPLSVSLTPASPNSNSPSSVGEVSLTTQRLCSRLEKHRQSLGQVQEKVDRVKALVERFGRVGVE